MKPDQGTDRTGVHRCILAVAVPALAFILLTPLVRATAEAPDAQESVADVAAVHPDEQQLEMIALERYPVLVTRRFSGVPVVTELFDHDGTISATDLEVSAKDPDEVTVSGLSFIRFGLKAQDLGYMGLARFEVPFNTVLIVYGGKRS